MNPEYDVAIAGAGPAGSALAIRLATSGHRVLLLDRARFPREKVCGDYVGPRGLRELLELGVLVDLCQREQPIPLTGARIYVDDIVAAVGQLPPVPDCERFGLGLRRIALDCALFRRARDVGVETREGCDVREFQVAASGVSINTKLEGAARTFTARAIVGADGAQSRVARQVGLEVADGDHTMVTSRSYVEGLNITTSCFYFTREFFPGFGWVFPISHGVANLGVGMLKSSVVRDHTDVRAFHARLADFVRSLHHGATPLTFSPPRGWMIKTYGAVRTHSFERGLLVGEAAGMVDPISGEGIAHGLESAHVAFDTLQRALAEDDLSAASLAEYDRMCRTRWDLDLSLADHLVALTKNKQLTDLWMFCLRVLGMLTERDPALAATFGGVLAGSVPTQEAFAPTSALRTWWRTTQLLVENARSGVVHPGSSLLRARDFVRMQDSLLQAVMADPKRFEAWAVDLWTKQLALTRRWFAP